MPHRDFILSHDRRHVVMIHHIADNADDGNLASEIQCRDWFIQQKNRRLLHDRQADAHQLQFTAGDLIDVA